MGKIVVSENVTLDGVVRDPAGAEGFGRGGWVGPGRRAGSRRGGQVLLDEALGAEAQLFGRRTYEFLAARWPSRSGELADRLNDMPKYVVSSTLKNPTGTTRRCFRATSCRVSGGHPKEGLDEEIVVTGSIRLVHSLMENDLVDKLRLMIYPRSCVLGSASASSADQRPKVECASSRPGPSTTSPAY